MSAPMSRLECLRHVIATASGLPWDEIIGPCRDQRNVTIRAVFAKIATERLGLSLSECGRRLRRDHSTIIHAVRQYGKRHGPDTIEGERASYLYDACMSALDQRDKSAVVLYAPAKPEPVKKPKAADWEPWQDAIVRRDYAHGSTQAIAEAVGRSAEAVIRRANRVWGLRKAKPEKIVLALPVVPVPPKPKPRPANVIGIRRINIIDSPSKAVGRVGDAARHLRTFAPVYRCNDAGLANQGGQYWRYGNSIMTDAALVELAERKGWRRFDELAA